MTRSRFAAIGSASRAEARSLTGGGGACAAGRRRRAAACAIRRRGGRPGPVAPEPSCRARRLRRRWSRSVVCARRRPAPTLSAVAVAFIVTKTLLRAREPPSGSARSSATVVSRTAPSRCGLARVSVRDARRGVVDRLDVGRSSSGAGNDGVPTEGAGVHHGRGARRVRGWHPAPPGAAVASHAHRHRRQADGHGGGARDEHARGRVLPRGDMGLRRDRDVLDGACVAAA